MQCIFVLFLKQHNACVHAFIYFIVFKQLICPCIFCLFQCNFFKFIFTFFLLNKLLNSEIKKSC